VSEPNADNERPSEPGYLLGWLIIGVLILFQALGFAVGLPTEHKGRATFILTGLYLQLWGFLFLAAYFFAHKTFFFRGLIWVCEHFSRPRGKGMAFFYFALAFVLGTMALFRGLGTPVN
jgi:hypothetical protein